VWIRTHGREPSEGEARDGSEYITEGRPELLCCVPMSGMISAGGGEKLLVLSI